MTIKELLASPIIQKYFGCNCGGIHSHSSPDPDHNNFWCDKLTSFNILSAMIDPIKKGDTYLAIKDDGEIREETCIPNDFNPHWACLRLPDAFQEKKCVCKFCCDCACKCHEKPDRIEVKFAELKEFIRCSDLRKDYAQIEFDRRVNELNDLARKTKGGN